MKKIIIYKVQFITRLFFLICSFYLFHAFFTSSAFAIVDPLSVPNNRYGIHIIQATHDEASPAASLVNSEGGDWGYITVLIEGKDKNKEKWQQFFDDLRKRHLIPLVRLATIPDPKGFWKRPDEGEASVWADFLDSLNWPTKNRYVIIYNEPNHAAEWGSSVDAKDYAKVLDQTITALKKKSDDFFVLNAGLDASTPQQLPNYQEELSFMQAMDETVPGIFDKLDGWVSHSYPNPGFVSSPDAFGKGTVRTWYWEVQQLRNLGVSKNLPIFITETGWKHAQGKTFDPSLPSEDTLSEYYKNAFLDAWNSSRIVAVTPFLLSYQDTPFDHFSFKKFDSPNYYPFFETIKSLPKIKGAPTQDNKAKLTSGEVYSSLVAGEVYEISLNFKNTGQSIWGDGNKVSLKALQGGNELGIKDIEIPENIKVEPNQDYTFKISIKAPASGKFKVSLNLFLNDKQFDSKPLEFETEVKSPVILQTKNSLLWKKDYSGEYFLKISGPTKDTYILFNSNPEGLSQQVESRFLLPDYSYEFLLERRIDYLGGKRSLITHKSKVVKQTLKPEVNVLDFGTLQPNIVGNLIHPRTFWYITPFSN